MVYWSAEILTQPPQHEQKKGFRQRIAERVYRPERTQEAWNRMTRDAGFIPIFNIDDLEARRQEIKGILDECDLAKFDPDKQREVVVKTFKLFFSAGNPWYRGLDNRELASKVSDFLAQYTDLGYMDEFIPDLFEESMHLLSLSWQALDVTNTPPYIIESRPIVTPNSQGINLAGNEQSGTSGSRDETV